MFERQGASRRFVRPSISIFSKSIPLLSIPCVLPSLHLCVENFGVKE